MKYFERVSPTYIENWPNSLKAMSFADVDIPLTLDEARALGTNIIELGEAFFPLTPEQEAQNLAASRSTHAQMWARHRKEAPPPVVDFVKVGWKPYDISSILARAEDAASKFPDGFFPRLGSRSPKDAFWRGSDHRATTGKEGIDIICAASERMYEDLLLALKENYAPHIFFRQWMPIQKWQEFRCFMVNRRLVGISQYNYHEIYPEIAPNKGRIQFGIDQFFRTFKDACHLDDVIFDVWVKTQSVGNESAIEVKLIEINPFLELTDPCLFDWHHHDQFDGSFKFKQ